MSKKLKVYLLVNDPEVVDPVCSKINNTRPVETRVFSSLKDFLTVSMQEKPDGFGVSMDFKHPKVGRFPKFFKMALNAPAIAFTEYGTSQSVKAVNLSQADYKISGKLNSHNLWMKLLLMDKKKKAADDKANKSSGKSGEQNSDGGNLTISSNKNPVNMIKGSGGASGGSKSGPQHQMIKSNNLDSILKQLDSMDNQTGTMGRPSMAQKKPSSKIHIQSTEATKFKKENAAENLAKLKQSKFGTGQSEEGKKLPYNITHLQNRKGNLNLADGKKHTHVKSGFGLDSNSGHGQDSIGSSSYNPQGDNANTSGAQGGESGIFQQTGSGPLSGGVSPQESNQAHRANYAHERQTNQGAWSPGIEGATKQESVDMEDIDSLLDHMSPGDAGNGSSMNSKQSGGNWDPATPGKDQEEWHAEQPSPAMPQEAPLQQGHEQDWDKEKPEEESELDKAVARAAENKADDSNGDWDTENPEVPEPMTEDTKNLLNELGLTEEEKPEEEAWDQEQPSEEEPEQPAQEEEYGEVSAPDQAIENIKKKRANKEKTDQENQQKIDILKESCEVALRKVYEANQLENAEPYDIQRLIAMTINHNNFKGYILFANNFKHNEEEAKIEELKTEITENMIKNGLKGSIEGHVSFDVPESEFIDWSEALCDFVVTFENKDSGNQYSMSFLQREKVLPPYQESEEDHNMMLVDLQHIPPGTQVNFEAFIWLPKNEKYVRMVKKDRSLSLDQIKRLMAQDGYQKVYIPKRELKKFVKFYVQNTVSWDLVTYLKEKKKAS